MRPACRAWLLACASVLGLASAVSSRQAAVRIEHAAPQPGPVPRTALLDVVVLDAKRQPVRGMAPAEFRVTLDGKTRPVLGLHYVVKGPGALAAARGLAGSVNGPVSAEPSRLVVFAVDEDSIDPGAEEPAAAAVGLVVDRLAVNDRVLLVRLPHVSPDLLASQDRGALRLGLRAIVGRAAPPGLGRTLDQEPQRSEAAPPGNDEAGRRGNIEARPPRQPEEEGLGDAGTAASRSARSLAGLMDGLRQLPGPKTVVVFSGGERAQPDASGYIGPSSGFPAAANAAIAARTVVLAVHVDRSGRRQDADLESLARLTGGFGGRASRAGDLETLNGAMAGSYVLQIERRPADEGRLRRLRVTTTRRGVTVISAARWVPREDPPPPPVLPVKER